MLMHMQVACPKCRTTADTNPSRSFHSSFPPLPVGQCKCGETKIKIIKEKG